MSNDFDLPQTIVIFNISSGRAANARGKADEIARFLSLAVGDGGDWEGMYADPAPLNRRVQVVGTIASLGSRMPGKDWRLVWGPCVYMDPTDQTEVRGADNAMFVVHSASQNKYIVSIAGTNLASNLDLFVEDADIENDHMVNTPILLDRPVHRQYVEPARLVSQLTGGIARGLYELCRMRDGTKGDIATFLRHARRDSSTKLIITGHSLGGALVSALALQLFNAGAIGWPQENYWIVPLASPPPGNFRFSLECSLRFAMGEFPDPLAPGNQLKIFNKSYRNTLDPVPHAWAELDRWYSYDSSCEGFPDALCTNLGRCEGGKEDCEGFDSEYKAKMAKAETGFLMKIPTEEFTGTWPVRFFNPVAHVWQDYAPHLPYPNVAAMKSLPLVNAHVGQYFQLVGLPADVIPAPIVY